ncbi:MAG: energy-coupled thiamine transporter ThiT [Clostridia bacterium]|nr:energy-coupled thiamine transporter ThiT [Clostridia bacterium]
MTQTAKRRSAALRLAEGGVMLALATVLSVFKLADLPYGGSITLASLFPIMLVSYRHGLLFGSMTALLYGVIQQLLGLNTLSYFQPGIPLLPSSCWTICWPLLRRGWAEFSRTSCKTREWPWHWVDLRSVLCATFAT